MINNSTYKYTLKKMWKKHWSFKAVALTTAFLFILTQSPIALAQGEGGGGEGAAPPEHAKGPDQEYVRTISLEEYTKEQASRLAAEAAEMPMPEGAIGWLLKETPIDEATPEVGAERDLHVVKKNEDGSYTFTKVDRLTGELIEEEEGTTDEEGKVSIGGIEWQIKEDEEGNVEGFDATLIDGTVKELGENGQLLSSTTEDGMRTVYASESESFGFESVEEALDYVSDTDIAEFVDSQMRATYVAYYDETGTVLEEYQYHYNDAGDTTYERYDNYVTDYWYEHTFEYDETDGHLVNEGFIDSDGKSAEITFNAQGFIVSETRDGEDILSPQDVDYGEGTLEYDYADGSRGLFAAGADGVFHTADDHCLQYVYPDGTVFVDSEQYVSPDGNITINFHTNGSYITIDHCICR